VAVPVAVAAEVEEEEEESKAGVEELPVLRERTGRLSGVARWR
jgi:hypothetical protein